MPGEDPVSVASSKAKLAGLTAHRDPADPAILTGASVIRPGCAWCRGPLTGRRRRFCSDLCRRRGQRAERKTQTDDYAKSVVRQIDRMGARAADDLDALGWLAEATTRARVALSIAVDGCRARG